MSAARPGTVRRLLGTALATTLLAGLLPAMAVPVAAAPAAAAAVPGVAAVPAAATAQVGAAAPAADVRQPTVRELPLSGIDRTLLARAPQPHAHDEGDHDGHDDGEDEEGRVSALGVDPQLKPALAAKVRLSKKRAAALIAVVADEPFPAGSVIQVRVKDRAGWSRWTELAVDPEHGPDPGSVEASGARVGSDPLLAVKARRIQVRIDTPTGRLPEGTRLSVVKAPTSASDARARGLTQFAAVGQPPIVTRAQWGADESWRSRAPYYTDNVRAGFVHHTASTSNYSESQAAAQVRAIYAYHTKSLGHSDIDYNFVVDRFGRLYEGRYGGIDRPVLGGHTAGFNEHTFAVVALGNFDSFSPASSDMARIKDSIARLFAWKLGLHGVSPGATVELVSAGFVRAIRYPKGTVARISATSSHQTVNYTACPGRYLQRELADIRALGDRYSDVVLSAPSPTGQTVTAGSTGAVEFSSFADRAVNWRADVMSPCSDTPVRSFTGSTTAAGSLSLKWDLRDQAGTPVLPATYTVRLSGRAADGTPVATVTGDVVVAPVPGGAWGPCANASRVAGAGPSSTSVLWGRIHAPETRVVVVTGSASTVSARSTALVAAPLAHSLEAPLLLTPATSLAEEVAAEIRAREATQVLVVGGSNIVSDEVVEEIRALGADVTRIGSTWPAATGAEVAARMGGTSAVLVTPDGSPAHALVGAALAATRNVPVLLAKGGSLPPKTAAALAGRSSVTVVASSALPDATVSEARGGAAWDRLAGADAVGAGLAVAGAVPASAPTAVLLPESASTSTESAIAAAAGVPVLYTASPVLSQTVADYLGSRPALRATLAPVPSRSLSDDVLGASSRVLLGRPWAPPGVVPGSPVTQAPQATSTRTVTRANAKPEPVRRGSSLKVTSRVRALFTDGEYRAVPDGVRFKVQFKAKGKKRFKAVVYGRTVKGKAKATVTATKSGRWRIKVGKVRSASDYVKVVR